MNGRLFPGLSLRSNPGLKLANAFGVKNRRERRSGCALRSQKSKRVPKWMCTSLLEIEPSAELDNTWRVVDLCDTSKVVAVHIQARRRVRRRRTKERHLMVQQIERFHTNLQPAIFTKPNVLIQPGIPVEIRHSIQRIALHVAGRSRLVEEEDLAREWRLAQRTRRSHTRERVTRRKLLVQIKTTQRRSSRRSCGRTQDLRIEVIDPVWRVENARQFS